MIAVVACVTLLFSAQVWAQPGGPAGGNRGAAGGMRGGMMMRGRGVMGDWKVTQEFNGMQMESILSFSRNQEGMTGQWIGMMGVNDLSDIEFADGQLTFKRTMQGFGGGEPMVSTFKGTLSEDGELTGTMTMTGGPQGNMEMPIEAKRMPRMPRTAGVWAMTMSFGEQEIPFTLTISANDEGQPTGKWVSEMGEAKVSNIESSRNGVNFDVASEGGEFQWEAAFEGTVAGNEITGTVSSEMGEIEVTGQRKGADLIGTWNLNVTSQMGERKQRLVINPDLTALYDATAIKNVKIDGDELSFDVNMGFGGQDFTMSFKGKVADSKLTGELSSDRGTQTVTGTKVASRFMGMGGRGRGN